MTAPNLFLAVIGFLNVAIGGWLLFKPLKRLSSAQFRPWNRVIHWTQPCLVIVIGFTCLGKGIAGDLLPWLDIMMAGIIVIAAAGMIALLLLNKGRYSSK